jgi:hypothetical protein
MTTNLQQTQQLSFTQDEGEVDEGHIGSIPLVPSSRSSTVVGSARPTSSLPPSDFSQISQSQGSDIETQMLMGELAVSTVGTDVGDTEMLGVFPSIRVP